MFSFFSVRYFGLAVICLIYLAGALLIDLIHCVFEFSPFLGFFLAFLVIFACIFLSAVVRYYF